MIYYWPPHTRYVSGKVTCNTIEEFEDLEKEMDVDRADSPHYLFIEVSHFLSKAQMGIKAKEGLAKIVNEAQLLTVAHALILKSKTATKDITPNQIQQ